MFGSGFGLGSRQLASGLSGVVSTALLVVLAGEQANARLSIYDFSVSEVLNGRMTASITFIEPRPSSWRPVAGTPIMVFIGSTRRFAGTVDSVNETPLVDKSVTSNKLVLDCLDYNHVPSRFVVTSDSYPSQSAGATMRALITSKLAADSIFIDGVTDGPTLPAYDIKDKNLAQIFDDLSGLASMIWSIGPYGVMEFRALELSIAPFDVTAANGFGRQVTALNTREEYRNVQIVRGSGAILVTRTSAAAITARQAVEGGSGRYERFVSDDSITTTAQANAKADGLLARYGQIDTEVEFETDRSGLRPGQRITLTFSSLGVSGSYLITQVRWSLPPGPGKVHRFRVTANSGDVRIPWLSFWKHVIEGTQEV